MTREGYLFAQRGMSYSARERFVAALEVLAQTLDSERQTATHARALAAGLKALEEAQDFDRAGRPSTGPALATDLDLKRIVAGHQTPLAKDMAALDLPAVQRAYYDHAQAQLALAVDGLPCGATALVGLGKLHGLMSAERAPLVSNCRAIQMVCYQAALIVDPKNHVAANELAVYLARQGRLQEARDWLAHSVAVRAEAQSWSNLAKVQEQLGETAAARRSMTSAVALGRQSNGASSSGIQWVSPTDFASLPRDVGQGKPAAQAQEPPRVSVQPGDAKTAEQQSGFRKWRPWR